VNARPADDSDRFSSDIPLEVEGFSEDERREIFSHIEQVAARSRITNSAEQETLKPRKRGSFFPIAVNIIAALCIAAGVYYANRYFGIQEERLGREAEDYLSAEGKIIAEVRRESQQRLAEKEQEISRIQDELQNIEEQQRQLEATMEERIAEQRERLREQMEEELASKREQLEQEGLSQEELQQQLEEYRSNRETEMAQNLENFREESREELAERQEELQEARETAEQILREAEQEKEELSRQADERIAELQERFGEERERLEEESAAAQEELSRLAEQRQQEQLMRDQMASMYRSIRSALEAGKTEQALETIEDFRGLLSSPRLEELPAVAKRRDVELFLLGILEERVRGTAEEESPDASLVNTARLVQEVRAAVDRAEQAEETGNNYDAARYYTQAIERISAVKTAHESLLNISAERRRETAEERAALAEKELAAGNREEALRMLTTAAAEAAGRTGATVRTVVDTLSAELSRRSSELERELAEMESRTGELEQRLAGLREQRSSLQGRLRESERTAESLRQEIEELTASRDALQQEKAQLEQQQAQLQQQYRRARDRAAKLEQDLKEAVDELAQFVTLDETNRRFQEVLREYRRLVERNHSFAGDTRADREAAREAFKAFIRSREVQELFPELQPIFQRLYGENNGG
jgi:chromosome segregation ATPase